MREHDLSRRRVLKMVAGGVAVTVGAGLGVWNSGGTSTGERTMNQSTRTAPSPAATSTPKSTQSSSPTPEPTPTSEPTPTPPPKTVDVQELGVDTNGNADATQAVLRAIELVRAGGTVILPPGDIKVSPRENGFAPAESKAALPIERADDGLTIRGAGPAKTRLFLGPDHSKNHKGFGIKRGYSESSDSGYSGLTIRDLTFDGNWKAQSESDGRIPNGFGVDIRGTDRNIAFENCVFEHWATNGGLMAAPGIRIRSCTFRHNGYGIAEIGHVGHGFNVNTTDRPGRVIAEDCLFLDNTGEGVDMRGGKVTIRNSVFNRNGWGVKIKPAVEEAILENCQMRESEHMHIHCVPSGDEGTGLLELNSVEMADSKWPAITLNQRPGTLKGTDVVIKRSDTEDHKSGSLYVDSYSPLGDREVDIDRLSVHETTGDAVYFANAYGQIEELRHTGTAGVGDTADVDVGTVESGEPISLSLPSRNDVGATES